ncbi:MAG: tetratricopeptide repeat protein [Ferruginibacter sp.]
MKLFLFFISTVCIFFSCSNNNTDEAISENPSVAANKEQQYKDLIKKYPDSQLLKERLVQYYRDNNNYDAAINETDAQIKKDSSNDRWWDIRATLFSENDDTANAILSWEKATSINPQPRYLLPLGYLYADRKNPKALFIAQLLMNSDSSKKNKEALLISGIYYSKSDKQKAISFYDQALGVSYTFMPAYREKAIALYDLAKYNDAIAVLQRALTVQSTYDEAYYWMGRCYEKLNRKDLAIESYQRAIDFSKETSNTDYIEAIDALKKLNGE